jgi:hypothetical protein
MFTLRSPLYDIDGPDPRTAGPWCLLLDPSHHEFKLCDCKPGDLDSRFAFPRVIADADATPKQKADAKKIVFGAAPVNRGIVAPG